MTLKNGKKMKNKITILIQLSTIAQILNPDPINAISGTGMVQTTLATIGGTSPNIDKAPLKMNKTANPRTQGTNINGFKTIGKPYIIGSAILNTDPAIDKRPKTLNLLTLDMISKTAIGKTLKRT